MPSLYDDIIFEIFVFLLHSSQMKETKLSATDLCWLLVFGPDSADATGFGIRFARKQQRFVVDDAWKRLEALVDGQSHGSRRHLADDLHRRWKWRPSTWGTGSDRKRQEVEHWWGKHQRSGPHRALEHQWLDDGAKPTHQLLDLRGASRRVGNVLDDQQGVPGDRRDVLL